jgi:ribosome recycling factor
MQKSVETLKHDLAKVRTGPRAHGLLDHIHVDYYGTPMPLNQVANVTLPTAHDRRAAVREEDGRVVEKAIRDSDLGLNPAASGDMIRVPMPRSPRSAARSSPRSCTRRPKPRRSRSATSAATRTSTSRSC